jgi:hypothetical protein
MPGAPIGLWSIRFGLACPSAAYEFVMESMTLCAFSWPISEYLRKLLHMLRDEALTLVVVDDVPEMVAAAVVRLADAHRVMR